MWISWNGHWVLRTPRSERVLEVRLPQKQIEFSKKQQGRKYVSEIIINRSEREISFSRILPWDMNRKIHVNEAKFNRRYCLLKVRAIHFLILYAATFFLSNPSKSICISKT